jgi:DtxR family transcriptional regulator, manganese transport regulator
MRRPSKTAPSKPVSHARKAFSRTRCDHQTEIAEDYVELIDDLIRERGEARAVDIATRLGVSHVTVSKTVARLIEAGLVSSLPYRSIFLTDEGQRIAEACRARHVVVHDFLLALGLGAETAAIDAEGIEHHVSAATLKAMQSFTANHRKDR